MTGIPTAIQKEIEASASAARQAKHRATQFLDAAKRAVEIAIEDSEAAALTYLNGIDPPDRPGRRQSRPKQSELG